MNLVMAYYFATFVVILITHETLTPVKGQCTVKGCDNGDPLSSIVAEIQQLRVELFDQLNKQVQSIHELLNASFQDTVMRNLQAVDRRFEEHAIYIKQGQSIHELLIASFQEMKSLHDTVNISLQAVDRCPQEHNIYSKQFQSIHDILNQSFQEIRSHHDTVMKSHNDTVMRSQLDAIIISLQAVDRRRSQEHDIDIKQGQSIHEILNETFREIKSHHDIVETSLRAVDRRSREHDIDVKQVQSIQKLLNESFQDMKSHDGTIMTTLQAVDQRRSKEHDIYRKRFQSIHEILNESFQEIKSQHGTVMTSVETVDRRLQEHDILMKNQSQKLWKLANVVDRRLQEHDISIKNQSQNMWKLANDIFDPESQVKDCSDIKANGQNATGVYEVCVGHQLNRICTSVFCDMKTASLVFQRRKDGSVNFNRTWAEYKQGFGNRYGEFWQGNEMLHLLTSKRNYKLRVDLEDFHGNKSFAEYTRFSISSSADNYRLTVSGYSGTAGDSLDYSHGKQFSTGDVDNDGTVGDNCARDYGGAWWHEYCSLATLNGIYYHRYDSVSNNKGIHWYHWHNGMRISLKATEMKLVPVA